VFTVAAESFSVRLSVRRLQTALDSLSLFSKGAKLKSIVIINIHILENGRCFVFVFLIISKRLSPTILFFHGATAPSGQGLFQYRGCMITLRHTTVGRTPLEE
jgi:hypothetical protein